jgi:glutamine amidotransferase
MAGSLRLAMIDYGSGNLRSVEKALQHAGADVVRCICLGYQILFQASEESPEARGLGHWPGRVVRFPARQNLKVPHMGWNKLEFRGRDPVFAGLPDPAFVYFVHSYYPVPDDEALVTARSTHGIPFAAACRRGRVRGVQFHPEKSQATGLRMLANFVDELRTPTC